MYLIVYIRDFPYKSRKDSRHTYWQYLNDPLEEVVTIAQKEVDSRGGKYGAVIYHNAQEVHQITKTSNPICLI